MKRIMTAVLAFVLCGISFVGCADNKTEEEKKLKLPEAQEFIETSTWNEDMMEAYLKPYWYTREIYNETVVFVGEEGEATLMFTPQEVHSVRNYTLDTTYVEGRDYVIEGNKIRRVKGGNAPYWEVDEYFLKEPNDPSVTIGCDMSKVEFDFNESRYLRYGEKDMFTSKQLAVTYRHNEVFDGSIPQAQPEKLTNFLTKLKNGDDLNVMVYGDSVAVGCNASGTEYGGNINPYMPNSSQIVCDYLEKNYGVTINLQNEAVGGWKVADCINGYNSKLKDKEIDLMILRIGGNDGDANEDRFVFEMNNLLNKFFEDHPSANVILQTPEMPNQQSLWTLNVGKIEGWTKQAMEMNAFSDQIALAPVQSFSNWVESRGKRTRDWLANNINHANDFMIRSYAQIILKVMLGSDFVEEIYE